MTLHAVMRIITLLFVAVVATALPAVALAGQTEGEERRETSFEWSRLAALEDEVRCADCDDEIVGRYLIALGQDWHPGHFRCAGCDRDLDGSVFHREHDQAFCLDCFDRHIRIPCDICEQPIKTAYYTDGWGNRFCERHRGAPTCSVCDRVISQKLTLGGVRYPDGRFVGNLCRASAITSQQELEALWVRVVEEMEGHGFDLVNREVPVSLVNQHDLLQGRDLDVRPNGQTHTRYQRMADGRRELTAAGIQVLYGMPELFCGSVLAHELVHVWLAERGVGEMGPEDEEGLCELGSWLWLQTSTEPLSAYQRKKMIQTHDTTYSRGFLRAKIAQDKISLHSLRRFVLKHERLPHPTDF